MKSLGTNLRLLSVLAMAGVCSMATIASANSSSDELYSESIYIQKSSAEVPTSLESNARPNAEAELSAASDQAIESIADLDNAAAGKKISQRRDSKKTSSN